MSNEKIMILKMLEEGKIGADEAAKLLAAINDDKEEPAQKEIEPQTNNSQNNKNTADRNIKFDELSRSLGTLSRGVAKKVGVFAKEMTPKLQTITETLVEKTVEVTDKLSKSIATPTPPPAARTSTEYKTPPTRPASTGTYRSNEKSCEIAVMPSSSNELYISAKSGIVYIKGYNGDKITAKITYKATTSNIDLCCSGNRYYLDYDDSEFSSVSIEAFVPEVLFNRVHLVGKSSKISIDGISANEILLETTSAAIHIKNLQSNYIKAITDNGEVSLEGITSKSVEVITANGKIDATQLDVSQLKLETDNAPINYKVNDLKKFTEYSWRVNTSNASMRVNLPISEAIAYDIKANTSLNRVSAGIAGLQYAYNESSYIEAKTLNYTRAQKIVKVSLDTSNGPININ